MTRTDRRAPRRAAALAVGVALLAGCGAAGATAPASTSAPATSAPATSAPSTSLAASPDAGGAAPASSPAAGYGGAATTPAGTAPVYHPPADGKVVYLTFDDGPDPTNTPKVLDLLRRYDAHATFFVVGRYVRRAPEILKRAEAQGNSVQSHSNTHPVLTKLPDATVTDVQLRPVSILIRKATGVVPTCLRPPYGAYDARVQRLAGDLGLRLALWDVDTLDWKDPGPAAIVSRALAQIRPGAVVLMHDGGADRTQTVEALQTLLPALKDRGYRFGVMCHD